MQPDNQYLQEIVCFVPQWDFSDSGVLSDADLRGLNIRPIEAGSNLSFPLNWGSWKLVELLRGRVRILLPKVFDDQRMSFHDALQIFGRHRLPTRENINDLFGGDLRKLWEESEFDIAKRHRRAWELWLKQGRGALLTENITHGYCEYDAFHTAESTPTSSWVLFVPSVSPISLSQVNNTMGRRVMLILK